MLMVGVRDLNLKHVSLLKSVLEGVYRELLIVLLLE